MHVPSALVLLVRMVACDLTSSCQRDGEIALRFRKGVGIDGMPMSCCSIGRIAKVDRYFKRKPDVWS
jgi:hypothetical protein